jgi:tetratricopeptide (TPR) repeat protein
MSRTATRLVLMLAVMAVVAPSLGCEQLDIRRHNSAGKRFFGQARYAEAAGEFETALKTENTPLIHYNLAVAYSRIFKPGYDGIVELTHKNSPACAVIPDVKTVTKRACDKEDTATFTACDDKNPCPSSFTCKQVELCVIDNAHVADLAANHFGAWLEANRGDADTRVYMTNLWLDSSQPQRAVDYWQKLADANPNDPVPMAELAGYKSKTSDWKGTIDAYLKVIDLSTAPLEKIKHYRNIGKFALSKLKSKELTAADSVAIADRAIGVLQKAAEIPTDVSVRTSLLSTQAALFNYRSLVMGASWAWWLDRTTGQDLQHEINVLNPPAKANGAPPTTSAPAKTGG